MDGLENEKQSRRVDIIKKVIAGSKKRGCAGCGEMNVEVKQQQGLYSEAGFQEWDYPAMQCCSLPRLQQLPHLLPSVCTWKEDEKPKPGDCLSGSNPSSATCYIYELE